MKFPIPTALSSAEAATLVTFGAKGRIVEAGALLGASTLLLSHTAPLVRTVDRFVGYGPSTLAPFMSNLSRWGAGNVEVRVGDCLEHLPQMEGEVAFIDLTGEEGITRSAMNALHPSIRYALVHDLTRVHCSGVERALTSLPNWRLVEAVGTLGVLVRR